MEKNLDDFGVGQKDGVGTDDLVPAIEGEVSRCRTSGCSSLPRKPQWLKLLRND
jgi:hypothetical protein